MKKALSIILKLSNLIALIIVIIVSVLITKSTIKSKPDYSHLSNYNSTLTLNSDISIANQDDLYIHSMGGTYYYKNLYDNEFDNPIFVYIGQRLDFKYSSEIVKYVDGNTVVKCRIVSEDSRITGTLEFELRPESMAKRQFRWVIYFYFLISGISVAVILSVLKLTKDISNSNGDSDIAKDIKYAVKAYDLSKEENKAIRCYIDRECRKMGYAGVDSFIGAIKEDSKKSKKRNATKFISNYLITSAWLCGISAAIITIITSVITSGFGVLWLISIPILIVGYGLKFYLWWHNGKEKRNELDK